MIQKGQGKFDTQYLAKEKIIRPGLVPINRSLGRGTYASIINILPLHFIFPRETEEPSTSQIKFLIVNANGYSNMSAVR